MDVWVVAAAAGAGYVAQRIKNLTGGGKNSSLDSSSHNFLGNVEVQGKSYRFQRFSEEPFAVDMSTDREQASTSEKGSDRLESESLETLDSCGADRSAVLILNSSDLNEEGRQGDFDSADAGDSLPQPSSEDIGFSFGFRRNRSNLRSKRLKSRFIKPRTSLESCLMAQLYKEHANIEEYTFYDCPPNKPIVRPFLVSDGNRIISRTNRESTILTEAGIHGLEKDKTAFGVPELPYVANVELQNKINAKTGMHQGLRSKSRETGNREYSNAQGSSHGAFRFYLGLTTGIISAVMANKMEMEKLHKLLKQHQNLVQDLHDELEMKDSLTVKELAMEDYESHDLKSSSNAGDLLRVLYVDQKSGNSTINECEQKIVEESMSNIEAELEAELERLESTINSSRLERKISDMAELNPDFVSDITVGELRADLFGAKNGDQPYACNRNESNSSTPHCARYPVDPKELSLRLHEVIQSRLEERIKELEMALHNSQSKLTEFPKTPVMELPIDATTRNSTPDEQQPSYQPPVINLSGEALSAYNEAFEAFSKLSDSDEEDLGRGFETIEHQENVHLCKEITNQVQNGVLNGNVACSVSDGTPQTEISCRMGTDPYVDMEENEDGEDEMEQLLIRQIVEKARQGSPAVLKAQRALLLNVE